MSETINFTKAVIDGLPLPDQGLRTEYLDAKQPGLRLRVASTGVKSFCVLKRIRNANPERITLGRYPDVTIEQARKKTAEILGKIAAGENPGQVRRALREEITFRDLFREYVDRHAKTKVSWRDDEQRYRDYLDKSLGGQKVNGITTPMISRLLSDIEKKGKSNATINNIRALASSIFSKGIEWGLVTANPVSATRMRKTRSRDRFLGAGELPRFFSSLAQEENGTARDYFYLSLFTGARRANVLSMRWSDIDLERGIWRIEKTKNGDPQNVVLAEPARLILKQRKAEAESKATFVFPGSGAKGHLVDPKAAWKRIFDRDELEQLSILIIEAGGMLEPKVHLKSNDMVYETLDKHLERAQQVAKGLGISTEGIRMNDLRIHDLRRTLGSWQAIEGASLPIIGKSLNHKTTQATQIYARLDLDPVRASVERATSAMLEAAGIQSKQA